MKLNKVARVWCCLELNNRKYTKRYSTVFPVIQEGVRTSRRQFCREIPPLGGITNVNQRRTWARL